MPHSHLTSRELFARFAQIDLYMRAGSTWSQAASAMGMSRTACRQFYYRHQDNFLPKHQQLILSNQSAEARHGA